MINPVKIEQAFTEFTKDLNQWIPDGILDVDLFFLKQFDLLEDKDDDESDKILQTQFPYYFHVIETSDKVTLFNEQFAIWIVPKMIDHVATTLTLISLVGQDQKIRLEVAFSTKGIYNTPKCVLKVLRYFLTEVMDTQAVIESLGKAHGS